MSRTLISIAGLLAFAALPAEGRAGEEDLAALLEEPQLLQAVLGDATEFDDGSMWLARSRAHRVLGETEDALAAATRAVEFLPTMTPEDLKNAGLDELGKKWK